jgi:hypothetical protein
MNGIPNGAENYTQKKIFVKSYLTYLDDMVNRKGQPQKLPIER